MKVREILGHIDCPTCGTAKGMRVTHDKNGEPFAYCEATCSQQLRIGGDRHRVAQFLARFPWASGEKRAAGAAIAAPVTDTGTAAPKAPARPAKAADKPAQPATVPAAPAPKRSPFDDVLQFMAGKA